LNSYKENVIIALSVSARSNSNHFGVEFVCMYKDLSSSEVRQHRLHESGWVFCFALTVKIIIQHSFQNGMGLYKSEGFLYKIDVLDMIWQMKP